MNEKIEELFEKAANKKFPTCETIIHPSELREFAELIIKECMSINNQFVGRRIGEIELDLIYKQHFGVE